MESIKLFSVKCKNVDSTNTACPEYIYFSLDAEISVSLTEGVFRAIEFQTDTQKPVPPKIKILTLKCVAQHIHNYAFEIK